MSEAERQQCLSVGGKIEAMGLSGNDGCVHPMPDAGKRCTDNAQCKAGCLLDDRKPGFKNFRKNEKVVGICAATDFPFGCRTNVVKGKAVGGICVD